MGLTVQSIIRRLHSQNPALRISAYDFQDHVWLFNIEVDSDFQGRGIGTTAIRELQKLNKPVWLTPLPYPDKKTALEKFYHRLGFTYAESKSKMVWRPKGN